MLQALGQAEAQRKQQMEEQGMSGPRGWGRGLHETSSYKGIMEKIMETSTFSNRI